MQALNPEQIFPIFFVVWVGLGLFSACFFFLNKNAPLKRKVWPRFMILTGVLFVGFVWSMSGSAQMLFILVPAVTLITLLNLRALHFCDACGATLINQNPLSRPAFCSKCGANLKQ